MATIWMLVLPAYLLGTLPSALIAAKFGGIDVTTAGSGNPGASNIFRLLGWKAGVPVLLTDIGKGTFVAAVGNTVIDGNFHGGAYLLGLAAVLGHVFPVTRGFKGGRGAATVGGVVIGIYPLIGLPLLLLWVVVAFGLKKASVGSILVATTAPLLVWLVGGGDALDVSIMTVLCGFVILRHAENIKRLLAGEERAMTAKGTSRDDVGVESGSTNASDA